MPPRGLQFGVLHRPAKGNSNPRRIRPSTIVDSRSKRTAMANAESFVNWLLNNPRACVGTVDAFRRSHDRSKLGPLKT